jgi:hypothetical protein
MVQNEHKNQTKKPVCSDLFFMSLFFDKNGVCVFAAPKSMKTLPAPAGVGT